RRRGRRSRAVVFDGSSSNVDGLIFRRADALALLVEVQHDLHVLLVLGNRVLVRRPAAQRRGVMHRIVAQHEPRLGGENRSTAEIGACKPPAVERPRRSSLLRLADPLKAKRSYAERRSPSESRGASAGGCRIL